MSSTRSAVQTNPHAVLTQDTSQNLTATHNNDIGPGPTGVICTSCNNYIITKVAITSTSHTHIVAAALCILCSCCCGCCFPYCMKSCNVVNHYCPQCKAFLGTHVPTF